MICSMQMQEEAGFRSSRTATTPRGIHLSECLLNKSLHVAVPKIQKDTETFVPHLSYSHFHLLTRLSWRYVVQSTR